MNIQEYLLKKLTTSTQMAANYLGFLQEYRNFHSLQQSDGRFSMRFLEQYPCLDDRTPTTSFEPHYMYHPAWAARVVRKIHPKKHVDISSTLVFCSIVSAFVPVEFYDLRPAALFLTGLTSKRANLSHLPFRSNSIESLSCMHTIEHIGLGRYGEKLDPGGDLKAISELKRVVKRMGNLILVTPVGKQRLRFNAHRIYSYDQIVSYFVGFDLVEFSLIPDDAAKSGMKLHASKQLSDKQNFGCGCFWFRKSSRYV